MRRALAVASLALAGALPAQAQSVRVGDACVLASTPDSIDAIMVAKLTPFDPRQRIPADYLAVIADEIGRRVTIGPAMQFGAFVNTRRDSGVVYPSEELMAAFTLERNGLLRSAALVTRSMSLQFDTLVMSAVRRAGADTAFPPAPERVRGDSLQFRLVVGIGERIDTGEVLLARLRTPAYRLSRRAAPVPPFPQVRYPDDMRRMNAQGEVLVHYVVGVDSQPVPGTVRVVRSTDLRFWEEVRKAIPAMRVSPNFIGDCPIPSRVGQPFNFSLRY